MDVDAVLIAGPTASGKSAFAMELAKLHDGLIINADSMQVYDHLHIITARPSDEDTKQVPHRLYGHRDPHADYSTAQWLKEVHCVLKDAFSEGRLPILVGGTGLYFSAILNGLSQIPEPKEGIRQKWRNVARNDPQELFNALKRLDPQAAKIFNESDTQRITRALEVMESSGKSILFWQQESHATGLLKATKTHRILIMPPRAQLHDRINARAEHMLADGAIEEVSNFLMLDIDPAKTACKAIGVGQIRDLLEGNCSHSETLERIRAATRQYAKRQCTWFNNQFDDGWERLESPASGTPETR